MDRRNLYFFYRNDTIESDEIETLFDLAEKNGFKLVSDDKDANIIASIGGDGEFLQAVRKTGFRDDCLYVGISTGQLGFYCDFAINDKEGMVEATMNSQIEVRRYPAIEVKVNNESAFYCLNECSIRSSLIKTFVMDVFIDDFHFETFRGDGLIVATPTGSTAYNKSVHGAVVDPKIPCLQVSELASLNNNRYRTLGSPFVLSDERSLTLKVVQDGNDYPVIGFDNEALSSRHCKQLDIKVADRRIKTVKLKNNSFWHKVQRSFL
ncbi:NAD kinase [Pseudalkalibacillus caeni]|uniref:NAD kinase n=1 Tax=Exobacillus caeni TaxID=2574798 RepID=A0A5R9FE03_9BACL|nr:NAD kinase [Pseudalkalibacillus caeni]TLS39103.1 NAD kinase [Pseudalkalibacillus caeni]